jgi:hypothetical protein
VIVSRYTGWPSWPLRLPLNPDIGLYTWVSGERLRFQEPLQLKVAEMSLLAPPCLSVCPHVTSGEPLNGFS